MNGTATLAVTTPTDCEVVLTRIFDAPRHMVFDALTRPELLKRWYGPDGWTLDVCEVDLKVGGRWRFVVRRPDGRVFGQRGVYREIVPGSRLVNSESWEDWDPGETLVTTVLVELGGRTTYTCTLLFPSRAVRDTVLKGGLGRGAAEGYDKLAGLLASLLAQDGSRGGA
jgi:uncharacterized protein YndB with AHSA1/START domain